MRWNIDITYVSQYKIGQGNGDLWLDTKHLRHTFNLSELIELV